MHQNKKDNNFMNKRTADIITGALSLIFILLITAFLLARISPSFNADDSPENVTAQSTLGIQHPPGYPLNTLAGKIFDLLPLGSHAFRSNLLSLFFYAATALLLFLFAHRHIKIFKNFNLLFAVLLPMLYLFCSTPFLQASSAKGGIYTMNAFFTVLLFITLFNIKKDNRYFYMLSFIYGFSMGNHWQSMIVLLPAVLIYCYFEKIKITTRMAAAGAFLFMLGTTSYIYLILRSTGAAVYTWGDIKNFRDLLGFIAMKQYKPDIQYHGAGFSLGLWGFYIRDVLTRQYPVYIALFSLPGIVFLFKKIKNKSASFIAAYFCLTASILVVSAPLVYSDTDWVMKPILTSSYIFLSVFIAAGICAVVDKIIKTRVASGKTAQIFIAALLFLVLFAKSPDYSRYYLVYDYINNTAKSIPENAVYFNEGEMNAFGADYMRFVEKKDFIPVSTPLLPSEWYRTRLKDMFGGSLEFPPDGTRGTDYLKQLMALNSDRGIYYSGQYTGEYQSFAFVPYGIINKVETGGLPDAPRPELLKMYSYRGILDKSLAYDEFGEYMIVKPYGMRIRTYGDMLLNNKDYAGAMAFYRKSSFFNDDDYVFNAMGECGYYSGDYSGAYKMFQNALKYNPNNVDSCVYLGLITARQRDFNASSEYFNRALAIKPGDPEILRLRSQVLGGVR
jgi:tetratricopeptide (TPR) repeat protein